MEELTYCRNMEQSRRVISIGRVCQMWACTLVSVSTCADKTWAGVMSLSTSDVTVRCGV